MAGGAFRRSAGFVACAGALVGALAPAALHAQSVRTSVVLGGVRIRYADALDLSAMTLSPAVTVQTARGFVAANGTASQPTNGDWSAQGLVIGSYFRPVARAVALEVGGNAGGSSAHDASRTGHLQGEFRAHLAGGRAGLFAGAGAGRVWNGAAWQGTRVQEYGAWAQGERLGVLASLTPMGANDSVRFTDATVSLRWRGARLELDGLVGHRTGRARAVGVVDPSDWASVGASWRVTERTALVASGGTYPLDLLQGFPSGRFLSLGLRLTGPGTGPSPEYARGASDLERDRLVRAGVGALAVRRVATGRYELRLRASGASRLEVTGDLTGWEPVRMRAEPDGWWSIVLEGTPGTYELNVRRDGGAWVVPPGLRERRDEFGGVSGLVTLR